MKKKTPTPKTVRKKRSPTLVLTALLGAVSLSYVYFVYLPASEATAALREELAEKQDYILQSAPVEGQNRALARELELTNKYCEQWQNAAPKGEPAAQFVLLTDAAHDAEVQVRRFEPLAVEEMKLIRRIPVNLECSGKFRDIFRFMKSIEALPQTIWIEDVHLESESAESDLLTCQLRLIIFADNRD